MLVDETSFGLVLYNHSNIYRFEEHLGIGQLNEYQFSLRFIGQSATHLRHHSVQLDSEQYRKHCAGRA